MNSPISAIPPAASVSARRFRKLTALVVVALALVGAASLFMQRYSIIRVVNRSGWTVTSFEIVSEAFILPCGLLEPGESRWFLRRPSGSCGIVARGFERGRPFLSGGGLFLRSTHGYLFSITLRPDLNFRLAVLPEPIFASSVSSASAIPALDPILGSPSPQPKS